MAIVMRRGPYSKFDPSKLLPGEWALVTSGHPDTSDGRALYHCFAAGVVRRMLTYEEAADEMRDILDVAFEGLKDDFTASVVEATSAANSAASSASSAATSANSAAANANAEAAKVLTYVQQELAAHPEWTTTVVDGSITQKKLHPSLHGLLNAPRRTLTGEVVSASDAYPCPPRGLVVDGRSVQDGTPTPDAPVEIKSVGPNLLDPSTFAVRTNSVDVISDGFVSDSTPTSDASGWGWAYRTFEATLPAGTYTVCFCVRKTAGSSATYAVMTSSDTVIKSAGNSFEPYTFTLAEATTIGIKIKTYDAVVACMVVEGTVTENPAEYIPYGGITLATVGRNLVDVPDLTRTMSNTYFIEGTRSSGIVKNTCRLEAGQTYTLSMDITSTVEPFIVSVGAGKGTYSMDVVTSGEKRNGHVTVTFTPTAAALARGDVFAFRAPRYSSQTTATYSISNFQLEKGATAHAYEPYQSVTIPIPLQGHALRSLPDGTRDEVTVDERGHATLTQRVGSVDLGTLTWNRASQTGGYRFYTPIFETCRKNADYFAAASPVMSESYPAVDGNQIAAATTGIAINAEPRIVVFDSSKASMSTAEFKAAVSGVMLYYPLATPVTIDLGAVQLADMPGPDLTAYVVAGLAPDIELTYERDVDLVIAALEAQMAEIATS